MSTIKPSEHVFVCGATGSGKSVLSDYYTAGMSEIVIKVDIKNDTEARRRKGEPIWAGLEDKDFTICSHLKEVVEATEEYTKIIYVPVDEEQTKEFYNGVAEFVYKNGNMRLWVDELMLFTDSAVNFPHYLKSILVSGRARNASCWLCTQRPVGVPVIALANTQHIFCFNLNQFRDREYMYKTTGAEIMLERPEKKYSFYYYREGMDPDEVRAYILDFERG